MGILRAAPDLESRLPVRRAEAGVGADRARRLLEALIVQAIPLPPINRPGADFEPIVLVPDPVGALVAAACGLAARDGDALAPDAATALATALAAGAPMADLLEDLRRHHGDATRAAQICWRREPDVLAPGHGPAAHLPRAVGVARAMRLRSRPTCVLTLLPPDLGRDPDVHNGLNFAAVCRAPVVFVARPGEPRGPGLAAAAVSYGIPAVRVAANAPLAVWAALEEGCNHARGARGPALIEVVEDREPEPLPLEGLLEHLAAAAGCSAPERAALRRAADRAWGTTWSNLPPP